MNAKRKRKWESDLMNKWWNCINVKIRKEIECYDKVMELHSNYQDKVYLSFLGYKQKAKEYIHKSERHQQN